MSCQRGNCSKSGRQKYQNTKAFQNDLHNCNKTIKALNAMQITGCCKRCAEVIAWKIKFNKYKPLTQPKKCVKCLQKTVKNSYYTICQKCGESMNICGKCGETLPTEPETATVDGTKHTEAKTKRNPPSAKRPKNVKDDDDDEYDNSNYNENSDDETGESEEEKNTLNEVMCSTTGNSKRDKTLSTQRKVAFQNDRTDDDRELTTGSEDCKAIENPTDDKDENRSNEIGRQDDTRSSEADEEDEDLEEEEYDDDDSEEYDDDDEEDADQEDNILEVTSDSKKQGSACVKR